MNVIFSMIAKDLWRDVKRPWGTLIMTCIPIVLVWLISIAFGSQGDEPDIHIDVAVLDQDEGFFSDMMSSSDSSNEARGHLSFHFVDSVDEGILLLEKRKVSAMVVMPENMTDDLLDGKDVIIPLYKNPAQQLLPKVIEQGTDILAVGVSEVLTFAGPEIRQAIDLFDQDQMPSSWGTAMLVYRGMQKMEAVETYFFPPLVQMDTVKAADFIASLTPAAAGGAG
ncbi:MAG: hypothetical protein GC154_13105 [bacterium]|nr:hypothetical protein [bacterium]